MSNAADAPLAADMDDSTLAAGLEDELSSIRPTGEEDDDLDDADDDTPEGAAADEGDSDGDDVGEEDDDLDDAPAGGDAAASSGAAAEGEGGAAATEGAAAPITRPEDGATWNTTAQRWQKDGKFVEGAAPEPVAAAKTEEVKPASTAEAGWTPFSVTVDREAVGIPEAQVSRANGHVILGIPEDKFADFQRRIVKGVAAERSWRQLNDGVRQLEEERKAQAERPAIRSDSEVEADLLLEVLKPHMADLLTAEQIENLTLKVQIAQGEEKKKVTAWETERTTKAESERTEHEAVIGQLAESIIETVENADGTRKPEYAHLSDDDLREVMADMAKHSRGIISKSGDTYERNMSLVQYVVSSFAKAKTVPPAGSTSSTSSTAAPAAAPSGAKPATPAPAGTTATAAPAKGDRADRFNAGQGTAAQPTTTSVKARRSAGTGRPSDRSTTGEPRRPKDTRTPAQRAEDEHKKTMRAYLNSPTLDIEGGDD